MYACLRRRLPGGKRQSKRSSVTVADGDRPTFVDAVQAAIASVSAELKEHGVDVAEQQLQPESMKPTAKELEWLAD